MNTHSIILARGGSKGIKNKNLLKINNKPLIYWSILASIKSKNINHTWVSSDSEKILSYSKKIGAKIIKRSKKFASDSASSESAWLESVNYIEKKFNEKIDLIVGVQPTSPIKTSLDFDAALKYFKKKLDSLFTSALINDYCVWSKKKGKFLAMYNYKNRKRRQKIISKYLENGSFYIFDAQKFKKKK